METKWLLCQHIFCFVNATLAFKSIISHFCQLDSFVLLKYLYSSAQNYLNKTILKKTLEIKTKLLLVEKIDKYQPNTRRNCRETILYRGTEGVVWTLSILYKTE